MNARCRHIFAKLTQNALIPLAVIIVLAKMVSMAMATFVTVRREILV